jgi:hypothetical protein
MSNSRQSYLLHHNFVIKELFKNCTSMNVNFLFFLLVNFIILMIAVRYLYHFIIQYCKNSVSVSVGRSDLLHLSR